MSASLWLIPRSNHPFTKEVQELITDTVPSNFTSALKDKRQNFIPHVTLTSSINPSKTYESSSSPSSSSSSSSDNNTTTTAQQWLDKLDLPEFEKEHNEVIIELDHLASDDAFFRKLTIAINPDKNLTKLASTCRRQQQQQQVTESESESEYQPHMSLLYADLPQSEIKKKIALVELQIGYGLGSLFACCGGSLCLGGSLVLVDTSKPVDEWSIMAERDTPWVNWRMSRNLA